MGDSDGQEVMGDSDEETGVTEEFTDENAAWLKPSSKRKLLEDSDDEEEVQLKGGEDSDDSDQAEGSDEDDSEESEDEDDDEMKVEKTAKKLKAKQDKMLAESDKEMNLNFAESKTG